MSVSAKELPSARVLGGVQVRVMVPVLGVGVGSGVEGAGWSLSWVAADEVLLLAGLLAASSLPPPPPPPQAIKRVESRHRVRSLRMVMALMYKRGIALVGWQCWKCR